MSDRGPATAVLPAGGGGSTLGRARAEDAAALAALEALCFPQPWAVHQLAAELRQPGALALAARADGELVGYVLFRRMLDEAELLRLAVRPGCRRRGFGRQLLERGIELLRERDIVALFLEVREDNEPALRLYRAAGWLEDGRRAGYYPDGAAAVLMRLRP